MKKNAMLKIAAILLVAVLLTTCAISTTFAKYVTAGPTFNETARVAKWGVEFAANDAALFLDTYGTNLVISDDDALVVAPGTSNSKAIGAAITGAPEVAFQLTATATVALEGWTVTDGTAKFYCPVVFTVGSETIDGNTYDDAGELADDLEAAIAKALLGNNDDADYDEDTATATLKVYPTGTAVELAIPTVNLGWSWAQSVNDNYDTQLGDLAANGTDSTILISYNMNAEQIFA